MSSRIRRCEGCTRRTTCFPRASSWLCDICIGEAMRLAAGIRKCKSCGVVTECDEFGDCKECVAPDKPKRRRRRVLAAKGGGK